MANEQSERALLRTKKKESERVESLVRLGVRDCSGTSQGRTLLWRLLQIGRVDENPYRANALETAFNCGEANVGLQIKALIFEVDPEIYITMMKENEANARSRSSDDDSDDDDNADN